MQTITIYMVEANGHLALFGGSPKTIMSRTLYTAPPSDEEKATFREKCIDKGRDLTGLDPDNTIEIKVREMVLCDNGGVLRSVMTD